MAKFNPLGITEKIQEDYANFFLTSFSPNNWEFMEKLREIPHKKDYLWKGPYISIPPRPKFGGDFKEFEKGRISDEIKLAFSYIKRLYRHQENAIKHILDGHNTITAVPTGSGKTEIFMIPILQFCYDNRKIKGTKAILIYPMNALARDQVERLRRILWTLNKELPEGEKITFAIYTGDTPRDKDDLRVKFQEQEISEICPLPPEDMKKFGCPRDCTRDHLKHDADREVLYCERNRGVVIDYQILTRKSIRTRVPDILITNYVQLEHILSRKEDESWLSNGSLRFVVLDEIHSYSGSKGVDVAFLMRRLRKEAKSAPIFIGASATLSQKQNEYERKRSIAEFAQQIFGSEFSIDDVIEAEYEEYIFPANPYFPEKLENFDELLEDVGNLEDAPQDVVSKILSKINPHFKLYGNKEDISVEIGKALLQNAFFQELVKTLSVPKSLEEIIKELRENPTLKDLLSNIDDRELADIIWCYLKLGSKCKDPSNPSRPLINVTVHLFFKTIERIYQCNECGTLYTAPRDKCEHDGSSVDEIGVCRFCGHTFSIVYVDKSEFKKWYDEIKDLEKIGNSELRKIYPREKKYLRKLDYRSEFSKDAVAIWISDDTPIEEEKYIEIKRCRKCGAILDFSEEICPVCGSKDVYNAYAFIRYNNEENVVDTRPISCPYCGNRYGRYSALSPIVMSSDTASVVVFDRVYSRLPEKYKKLLIFTDNRQIASYLAKHLEDTHFDHTLRILIYRIVREHGEISLQKLIADAYRYVRDWPHEKTIKYELFETAVLEEICSLKGRQRSLENLGLIEVTYDPLDSPSEFQKVWNKFVSSMDSSEVIALKLNNIELWRSLLIALLDYIRQKGAIEGLHNNPLGRGEVVGFSLNHETKKRRLKVFKLLSSGRTKQRVLFQKVFRTNLKNDTLDRTLKIAFEFLEKNKLIKKAELKCCGGKKPDRAEGYVINKNRVLLKIPENIFKCSKCQRIYSVSPDGVCLTYDCDGKTEKIPYKEFEEYMKKHNYYFRLYQEDIPVKMITFEDTGAIPSDERHKIELEFKKNEIDDRKVDVIVATPTLELGVDIGDLTSVGIYKAPPSPANYVQRVGRAGRKEKMALNVTFLYLSPLDRYYYEKPEELIRGTFEAPKIDIENRYLLQKHVNAVILYTLMKKATLTIPRMFREFAEGSTIQAIKQEIDKNKDSFLKLIEETFKIESLRRSEIEIMVNTFIEDLEAALARFKRELEWYSSYEQKMVQKREYQKAEKIKQIRDKLENSQTVSYLMDINVLPRYAFPGTYVEIKDMRGKEEFEGRSRNIAITELAPLMRTFIRKKVYKSVGVDMEVLKPKEKVFYICPVCDTYITDDKETFLKEGCPICHYKPSRQELETKASIESAIEPNIMYLKEERDTIFQLREYQEARSMIYLSKVFGQVETRSSKIDPNIKLAKYPNPEIIKIVDKVIINNEERDIELCEKCGKVKETLSEERRHYKLGTYEKCDGKFRKFVLYHRMPTNVISIKFESDTILGQKVENIEEFLVTFKNAILNAAQRILYAQDGEIEGEVRPEKMEILIYDNVDGGAGYADRIYEKFEEILEEAYTIATTCECEKGCPNCLWSYWRKRDIPKIDKTLIIPVLDKVVKMSEEGSVNEKKLKEVLKKEFHCENLKTMITNAIDGPMRIKQALLEAKNEVYITSLYVTDDKISWPDGEYKSWVDILSLLALKGIKVHLIVRNPTSEKHKRALERLKANGVKVYIYEKPLENSAFQGIVHAKIIVCDPFDSSRKVIFTSANLSAEVTKNVDFYLVSEEEECTRRTLQKIHELINESRKYSIKY